jgi:hypothetical protein
LFFYIDGVLQYADNGVGEGWNRIGLTDVPAGTHTFTWAYEKDETESDGSDTVWIDNVVVPNNIGWSSINALTDPDAASQSWTTPTNVSSTSYRVRVRVPGAAPWLGEDISNAGFTVDSIPPTVSMTGTALATRFQTSTAFTPKWTGTDPHAGILSYDIRFRRAKYTSGFGSYTNPPWRANTTATSANFTGAPGDTYCFDVRARDRVGNLSTYSPDKCTAIPVNNTTFSHTSSWQKRTGSGYYLGTYSYNAGHQGAYMKLTNVVGKRFALIATKCSGCGTVQVYRGSTLLKTISLNASSTLKKQVIPVTTFSSVQPAATFKIRISSSGDPVRIEGFGVSAV